MIVADASFWVSLYTRDDIHHAASRQWFEGWRANNGVFVAPNLLLAEVGGAVVRRSGRIELANRVVADLLADPAVVLVPLDQDLAEAAAGDAVAFRLRGADAAYVTVARQFNLPLMTWDREQAGRVAAAMPTFTPATAPTVPPAPAEDSDGRG